MNAATVGSVLSLAATLGVAWLLTYAVHSTALIGTVWLAERGGLLRSLRLRDVAWRTALLGGVLTATLQLAAGLTPFGGAAELQAPALPDILTSPDAREAATATRETDPALAVVVRTVQVPPVVRIHLSDGPHVAAKHSGHVPPVPAAPAVPAVPAVPAREALPVATVAPVTPATPAVPARANLAVPRLTAAGLAFLGWAVVASVFLLRLAVLRARLLTTLGERAPVVDPMVRARLEGLCQDVGHARPVRLTTAEGLRSPVALGWSEICLPAEALLELDDAQQRSVLAHELAHLRRLDPVWLVMGTVLEHLFFFQPLNRLARARMQEVAEFLCDDWAAARNGSGLDVARGLASVAAWLDGHAPSVPLAGMAEHPSQLLARVTRLLERGADEVERLRPWHVGGMALLLLMTVLVAPGVRAAPERLVAGAGQTRTPAPRSDAGAPQQQVRTMVAVQSLDRELLDGASDETSGGSGSPLAEARSEPAPARAPGKTSSPAPAVAPAPASTRSALSRPQLRAAEAQRGQGLLVGPGAPPVLLASATPGVPPAPPVPAVAATPPAPPTAPRPPGVPSAAEIERIRRDAQRMALDAQRQARDAMRKHGRKVKVKGHHERAPADPKTVDALISALKDADPGVRRAAAESLGRIGDARAVEPLSALLSDGNVDVRRSAVEALGELDDPKAIPALGKATGDANPAVRREAAEALLSFDEPAATEPLIKLLGDADPKVRVIAMEGLSHRGDRRALAPLAKLVKDPNVEVRARAVRALSRFRDPAAQEALVTALKDENADVRTAAAAGLGEMDLKTAPAALLEATKDPSSEVRQQAAESLGEIHDGKAVPQLKALLDDSDADVRAAAVEALSEIRDGASLQALIAAMQSKDVTVRRAAAQALGQRD